MFVVFAPDLYTSPLSLNFNFTLHTPSTHTLLIYTPQSSVLALLNHCSCQWSECALTSFSLFIGIVRPRPRHFHFLPPFIFALLCFVADVVTSPPPLSISSQGCHSFGFLASAHRLAVSKTLTGSKPSLPNPPFRCVLCES